MRGGGKVSPASTSVSFPLLFCSVPHPPTHPVPPGSVRRKLNAMSVVFSGKNVLLVDDSIVRGTTMAQIVSMCRRAGAKKVYLASSSPPVRYPNVYGVDMPTRKEFVAHNLSEEEVCAVLGADGLIYQVRSGEGACREISRPFLFLEVTIAPLRWSSGSIAL